MTLAGVKCRSCDGGRLHPVLSLGSTPLANSLLTAEELDRSEPTYPLELAFCEDCSLAQITETVPPDLLFGHYLYFSSFSETMLAHAAELAEELVAARKLGPESLVVELASNDGYLLQDYARAGVPVLGVEPAANVAEAARARGIPTLTEFFDQAVGERLRDEGKRADVVHAHNVLAHVADLNGFVAGIAALLKEDGIAVIEAPHVREMVRRLEFDTIYHEHLCYYSLSALKPLFERHGLRLVDARRVEIHGGSIQLRVAHSGGPSPELCELLAEEEREGVDRLEYFASFAKRVEELRATLLELLAKLRRGGRSIAAYGASAKGSTLLNYCGLGPDTIDFVVDRSTVKQGLFTPGTHLPILSPEVLLERRPDLALLLTWNFKDEILAQQEAYRQAGGRFILPIPWPEVV